jgi:hypothetical protein
LVAGGGTMGPRCRRAGRVMVADWGWGGGVGTQPVLNTPHAHPTSSITHYYHTHPRLPTDPPTPTPGTGQGGTEDLPEQGKRAPHTGPAGRQGPHWLPHLWRVPLVRRRCWVEGSGGTHGTSRGWERPAHTAAGARPARTRGPPGPTRQSSQRWSQPEGPGAGLCMAGQQSQLVYGARMGGPQWSCGWRVEGGYGGGDGDDSPTATGFELVASRPHRKQACCTAGGPPLPKSSSPTES